MTDDVAKLVRELYVVRDKLAAAAGKRGLSDLKFTLDGKLVGDIGEFYAVEHYGLLLLQPGTRAHDARAPDGRRVQVKATQKPQGISLDSEPDFLLVLLLKQDGLFEEIYNGPGSGPWRVANKPDKKGYRFVSNGKLVRLNDEVPPGRRVPEQRSERG